MKKNFWLHRISHHANISRPLLRDYGYLSIGFSDFVGVENFIDNIISSDKNYLDKITKKVWGKKHRIRLNLSRFIKMAKGDWVIVPGHGDFSIYEIEDEKAAVISALENVFKKEYDRRRLKITDGKLYLANEEIKERLIDLGFVRKVKPIQVGISRKKYADNSLNKRLKFQGTNANISDLANNIKDAQNAFLHNSPINLHSQIQEVVSDKVLNIIREKLNPDKWEALIKTYFEKCGADSVDIPSKNNRKKKGDADIISVFERIKTIVFVQAKFHDEDTKPAEAVRQVYEFVNNFDIQEKNEEYTIIKWVITSADSFAEHDKDEILEKNIKLITGKEFTQMLLDVGISGLSGI